MSSCCGGNCGCSAGCKCGTGCSGACRCKMYPDMMSCYSESTSTAATNILLFGVAPLKPIFEGSAEVGVLVPGAENGGGRCKYCGANNCTCN